MAHTYSLAELLNIAKEEGEKTERLLQRLKDLQGPSLEYIQAEKDARDKVEENRLLNIPKYPN